MELARHKPAARANDYKVRLFELPPASAQFDARPKEMKSLTVRARTHDAAHKQAAVDILAMGRKARVIQNQGGGGNVLIAYLYHPNSSHPDMQKLRGVRAPRDTTLTAAQLRRR